MIKLRMIKQSLVCSLMVAFFSLCFQGAILAQPELPKDPNWLVDGEISQHVPGWNEGFIKCKPPYGGYNELTEHQKILNSWGYKARPIEEIKNLLPEPHYDIMSHPEIWGTFRVNETAWEPVKPRGPMWERFMAQTKKNIGTCYLDKKGWLRNYRYGIPFPELKEDDPQIALKLVWNYFKRYKDNDRLVPMDITTRDRAGYERHNLMLNHRLQMNGRVRPDEVTEEGLYKPNPKNLDFIYATPYVAPYNLRGTIPLYYRYDDPDKEDDMWIYIPSMRRVRRMSTAQHQDRLPGGLDWTWDNTEGFEGHVTRFNWTYLGRKELLIPVIGHSHTYYNPKAPLDANDQYYQRRNCYVIKATYKEPINMKEMILYLDPLLYNACYSVDTDLKGRTWIVQSMLEARNKNWFAGFYNGWAFDVQRRHATRALFAYHGSVDFRVENLAMDNLKKVYLAR